MPKAFDDMVSSILDSLKKQFPKSKEDELRSRAYALATSQWKKSHGGKLPSEEDASEKLDFNKLLTESARYTDDGYIIVARNVPLIFEAKVEVIKE